MRIILKQGEAEEVIPENAALLKVTKEEIRVNAMFEPPKLIPGAIATQSARVPATSLRFVGFMISPLLR